MTQSMTVNGVLVTRGTRRKQRPGRKAQEQADLNRHRTRRRKKSNADMAQEVAR